MPEALEYSFTKNTIQNAKEKLLKIYPHMAGPAPKPVTPYVDILLIQSSIMAHPGGVIMSEHPTSPPNWTWYARPWGQVWFHWWEKGRGTDHFLISQLVIVPHGGEVVNTTHKSNIGA